MLRTGRGGCLFSLSPSFRSSLSLVVFLLLSSSLTVSFLLQTVSFFFFFNQLLIYRLEVIDWWFLLTVLIFCFKNYRVYFCMTSFPISVNIFEFVEFPVFEILTPQSALLSACGRTCSCRLNSCSFDGLFFPLPSALLPVLF